MYPLWESTVAKTLSMCIKDTVTERLRTFTCVAFVLATCETLADTVPYFPSADDEDYEGLVRIINHSDDDGEVTVVATDDQGTVYESLTLEIGASETLSLSSEQLEQGDEDESITGIGEGDGDWRLEITSDVPIETLPYIRTSGDELVPMHGVVALVAGQYRVPSFHVPVEDEPKSLLRIFNESDEDASLKVVAIDESGTRDESDVNIPAGYTITIGGSDLTSGETPDSWPEDATIDGALDLENGRWEILIGADTTLSVLHLVETASSRLVNHSTLPAQWWRMLVVAPESRCAGAEYDRNEYGTRYSNRKDEILAELGSNFGPYSGDCFDDEDNVEIEHIVALSEAHESGMCWVEREEKRTFAGDVLNLTFAERTVNRAKSAKDAYDWVPEQNKCWFANRVVAVKVKYGMTVDPAEAEALEIILASCESNSLIAPVCSQ